jgi:uncharacterized protein YggE
MRFVTLAVIAAFAVVLPASAQQEPHPRLPTLSVSGSGEAELKPDFARIIIEVETQGDAIQQVVARNASSSDAVIARIIGLGITKDQIRTANFEVAQTPLQTDRNGNEVKVPKFTASHRLQIITRDLGGIGKLAGEILASPDMRFDSVSFGLDRQEAGEDEARKAAVRDAKRQADVYAEAAGVTLGRVLEVRDGSAQPYQIEGRMRAMAAKAAEVPIIPPATIRYTAGVSMVWEIAPKP